MKNVFIRCLAKYGSKDYTSLQSHIIIIGNDINAMRAPEIRSFSKIVQIGDAHIHIAPVPIAININDTIMNEIKNNLFILIMF